MINTYARSLAQKTVSTLLLGVPFLILTPIVTVANALFGMKPFYTQTRYGRDNEPFQVYKFKSMRNGDGPDSERVTPVGRFLRKSSLDEIPQLINIWKGEMDLVGWRPLNKPYQEVLSKHMTAMALLDKGKINTQGLTEQDLAFESVRACLQQMQSIKPGITGPVQTSKMRGEIESASFREFSQIANLDRDYATIREKSFLAAVWRDASIIVSTPHSLLKNKGHVARDIENTSATHSLEH